MSLNPIQYFPYHISFLSKLPFDVLPTFLSTLEKLWEQFLANILPHYPTPIQNDIKYVLQQKDRSLEEVEKELRRKRVYKLAGKPLALSSILHSIHSRFVEVIGAWYLRALSSSLSLSPSLRNHFSLLLPSFHPPAFSSSSPHAFSLPYSSTQPTPTEGKREEGRGEEGRGEEGRGEEGRIPALKELSELKHLPFPPSFLSPLSHNNNLPHPIHIPKQPNGGGGGGGGGNNSQRSAPASRSDEEENGDGRRTNTTGEMKTPQNNNDDDDDDDDDKNTPSKNNKSSLDMLITALDHDEIEDEEELEIDEEEEEEHPHPHSHHPHHHHPHNPHPHHHHHHHHSYSAPKLQIIPEMKNFYAKKRKLYRIPSDDKHHQENEEGNRGRNGSRPHRRVDDEEEEEANNTIHNNINNNNNNINESEEMSTQPNIKRRKVVFHPDEKRLSRFRSAPSKALIERIRFTLENSFILVAESTPELVKTYNELEIERNYEVLDHTTKIYHVYITHLPACNCPASSKGLNCIHILFIFLRVLNVALEEPILYQRALLTSELCYIFSDFESRSLMNNDSSSPSPPINPLSLCKYCFEEYRTVSNFNASEMVESKECGRYYKCASCSYACHMVCLHLYKHAKNMSFSSPEACPQCASPLTLFTIS